jgi:hypothetical protein
LDEDSEGEGEEDEEGKDKDDEEGEEDEDEEGEEPDDDEDARITHVDLTDRRVAMRRIATLVGSSALTKMLVRSTAPRKGRIHRKIPYPTADDHVLCP